MMTIVRFFPAGAWLIPLLRFVIAQNVVSLSISAQPTSGASAIVPPSFAGFGIEPSNLYSFTGGHDENLLTKNLLQNLADYTGVPPHLRIGGNTQDYMTYKPDLNDYLVQYNPDPVGQGAYASDLMFIGPRYFEVLNRLPAGTPITFGLNLAYQQSDYINQMTTMAEQAVDRLTDVNLVSFEVGNEPDLYFENGFRPNPQWSASLYAQEWLERANAVWERVLKPKGMKSNFFEPAATASTLSSIGTSFEISNLDRLGLTQNAIDSPDPLIAQWNQHDYYYYIGVSEYLITQDHFLTLSTTNDQFAAWVTQTQQAHQTGYRYALREMGVVGPIGLHEITDVFGAALWSLNFLFYAATLNISMVGMHMTENSNASAWQPTDHYGNPPFVRPNYYAFVAFDQTIGPTCQAQIGSHVLHNQPEEYSGRLAVYSVYQDGTLGSIVLINSKPSNTSETNKDSMIFALTLDKQFAGQVLYLSFLTNNGADAFHGTTFNGVSYEESGDGTATVMDDQYRTVTINDDGTINIMVRDTQALVANIGGPLNKRKPNKKACSAFYEGDGYVSTSSAPPGTSSNAATSLTPRIRLPGSFGWESKSRGTGFLGLIFEIINPLTVGLILLILCIY
jgi:Glycosyl hydrolase family 79 C-terminal beta domain